MRKAYMTKKKCLEQGVLTWSLADYGREKGHALFLPILMLSSCSPAGSLACLNARQSPLV